MGKYFVHKSRNIRKKIRQNIKNQIIKDYYSKGRLFVTNHYVTTGSSWIDILFLGKDKATLYSCSLTNCYLSLKDKADELASEESEKMIPYDINLEGYAIEHSNNGFHQINFKKQVYKEFNNLTRFEWCEKREQELIKHVYVSEYIKLDYSYYYAIGIDASINRVLDTDSINDFIIEFIENGEKSYSSNETMFLNEVYVPKKVPTLKSEEESTEYHENNNTVATKEIPETILKILGVK